MAKKVTELPAATSFEGLVALGVDTVSNLSVQVPLQFVKDGADAAAAAATLASEKAAAADTATQSADNAAANTNAAIATANEVAANPTTIGEDNYVYVYDLQAGQYIKTDIYVRGTDGYGAVLQDSGDSTTGVMSQKATTDALARKIELDGEGLLPAAGSTAAIAHLRAVDAAGGSVIATPAQIREMVGIDYSSLVEQEVTGEFLPDLNGIPRQVYIRTCIGIISIDRKQVELPFGAQNVWWVSGFIETVNNEREPPYIIATNTMDYYYCLGVTPNGTALIHDIGAKYSGCKYALTFKYTKL